MRVQRSGRKAFFEEWRVCRDFTFVLILVAVSSGQIRTIGRAPDRDCALGAAADGANLFARGRAETARFSLLANWTRQRISSREPVRRIPCAIRNAK